MDGIMATIMMNLQSFGYRSTVEKVLKKTELALSDAIDQL
jgi:hypothetical protein